MESLLWLATSARRDPSVSHMKTCYFDIPTRSIVDLTDDEMQRVSRRRLIINRINVPLEFRGQGHARTLMAKVLRDADASGTILALHVAPSGGLSYSQLVRWYKRLGFVEERTLYLVRYPNDVARS